MPRKNVTKGNFKSVEQWQEIGNGPVMKGKFKVESIILRSTRDMK